jgi:hypothetical protein
VRSPRRRALPSTVGASVLLLLATACGSGSGDSADDQVGETAPGAAVEATAPAEAPPESAPAASDGTSAADDADPTPTEPADVVPEALQFTAPLVGGGTFDGAAAVGKPTVFWFWAPT